MKKLLFFLLFYPAICQAATIINPSNRINASNLPGGATSYIQNTNSLQGYSTFYVSSGTVEGDFYVQQSTTDAAEGGPSIQGRVGILSIADGSGANNQFSVIHAKMSPGGIAPGTFDIGASTFTLNKSAYGSGASALLPIRLSIGPKISGGSPGYFQFQDGSTSIWLGNSSGNTFLSPITLTGLDCTGNTNGGALTADASGLVTCTDDDSGAGGGSAIIFTTGTSSGWTQSAVSTGPITVIQNQDQFRAYKNPNSAGATYYYEIEMSSIASRENIVILSTWITSLDFFTSSGAATNIQKTSTTIVYTQTLVSTLTANNGTGQLVRTVGTTIPNSLLDTSSVTKNGQPTGAPDGTKFLRDDWSWQTPAGSGDMVLATTQTVTAHKTFTSSVTITSTLTVAGAGGGKVDLGNSAGSAWLSLRSHTSLASDYNIVFPSTAGTASQILEIGSVSGSSITLIPGNKRIPLSSLDGGVSGANVYDYGGATSLEVPNGTGPTIDTTGEIGVDTTAGQFIFFDGINANVLAATQTQHMTIETPAVGDYPFFFQAHTGLTVTSGICISSSATSATIQVDECSSAGVSCTAINTAVACTTSGANFAITNSAIDSGDWIRVKVTAVSGTPGWTAVSLRYRETRQ